MIYFDNSSTTQYKPESVINAVTNTLKYLSANPGRASHSLAMKVASLVAHTRRKTAQFVGADIERVIFCYNCTDALNMAIFGTIQPGGHVITTAYEHNSVLRPLYELKRSGKIDLTVIPPNELGIVTAEMVERALKPNTYMAAINHVSNVTGATSPITEIGRVTRKRKIMLLVDGAQSVGYTKIDIAEQNIDMLAVAPHKGLHGPQGIGCLILGKNVAIRPSRFGGTGTSSSSTYQPSELPESMEAGTVATPNIAGLGAAIDWNIKNFFASQSKTTSLSMYMSDKIRTIPNVKVYTPENVFNGIFSFNVSNVHSSEISDTLSQEFGICTRSGLHCAPLIHKFHGTLEQGMVRASLGSENTMEEIDIFIDAIRGLANCL